MLIPEVNPKNNQNLIVSRLINEFKKKKFYSNTPKIKEILCNYTISHATERNTMSNPEINS
jgi:hypothetical protein